MRRRQLLKWAGALTLLAYPGLARYARGAELPAEVAGLRLPRTPLALGAVGFARASCPDYLFNHCMRTFLFGALLLKRQHREYRGEDAFIGAALHDLGLLPAFETPKGSFEVDGAEAAERWVRQHHGSASQADRIWHTIELHDGEWALTRRQGPEAMLVALGAGTDVDGPAPGELDRREIDEVIGAFPRLKFKQQFTTLLVAHCERKPASQHGTWLESLCREHVPHATPDEAVEQEIAAAAFAE
jgi:hypothetical protein